MEVVFYVDVAPSCPGIRPSVWVEPMSPVFPPMKRYRVLVDIPEEIETVRGVVLQVEQGDG